MNVSEIIKPADKTALAIRQNLDQVESALTEFDRISAGLADLGARFPVDLVYDVTTTKGMAEAVAHRAAWRDPRINVEKYRKTAKAPVLALGKDIDARAAWLTEQLLIGETPVDKQIKAEEARKEAEKQAKISAEFGRVQAIEEALADLHMIAMAIVGKPSAKIAEAIESMKATALDPAVFQERMPQAVEAQRMAVAKLEQALKAQLFNEAEAAKNAADKAELEELRRAAAAQKAKDEAADAERRAAERKAAQVEQARLDAAAASARAEADRIAAEKRAQAQAEHEAAMKAQREALAEEARLAAERAEKEATKKRKAEAADKKLRDAAPKMLAALRGCREYLPEGHALAMVDAAIEAAA